MPCNMPNRQTPHRQRDVTPLVLPKEGTKAAQYLHDSTVSLRRWQQHRTVMQKARKSPCKRTASPHQQCSVVVQWVVKPLSPSLVRHTTSMSSRNRVHPCPDVTEPRVQRGFSVKFSSELRTQLRISVQSLRLFRPPSHHSLAWHDVDSVCRCLVQGHRNGYFLHSYPTQTPPVFRTVISRNPLNGMW